jgi:hypothetical protein
MKQGMSVARMGPFNMSFWKGRILWNGFHYVFTGENGTENKFTVDEVKASFAKVNWSFFPDDSRE